jgi:hypothetical protein
MKKSFFPHIVAIVSFLLIAFIYCSPAIEGKQLVGPDTEGWLGMSKEIKDYNSNNPDAAYWTNSMFGGMPSYQISMKIPSNILKPINIVFDIFPQPIYMLFLYMIGFYILLLAFRLNPWLSMIFAVAFAFGSYNLIILVVGHNTKAVVIAYMAPLIGSIAYAFRQNKWTGAILTALFLALAIQGNHLQITYYTLIILICFGVAEFIYAIIEKRITGFVSTFGLLLVAALIGVGINATRLLTTSEYAKHTMRGKTNNLTIDSSSTQENLSKDYITNWSYGIDETLTLLIPNFKGGSDAEVLSSSSETAKELRELGVQDVDRFLKNSPLPTYFGTQPGTSGPVYAGAIICFLFVLGLFLVEGRNKWWILAAFILSILLSWGKNFMPFTDFFIDHVPFYGKFRAVSMTLVIATFCMVLMAALALNEFFKNGINSKKNLKALYISAGVVGGICLLFSLIPSLADLKGHFIGQNDKYLTGDYSFMQKTLPLDRMAMVRSDAFRSFVFIALSFAVLWLYNNKKYMSQNIVIGLLGVLFLMDMVPVAKRYLNNDKFQPKRIGSYFTPTEADKMILNDHSYSRVLDMTQNIFNSSRPSYFHKSIGGYHAAKLRRYQELINIYLGGEIQNIGVSFGEVQKAQSLEPIYNELAQSQILNMLNMKYLIYNGNAEPIINPFANGNAWFVKKIYIAQNADEEMLKLGTINTKEELVVDKDFSDLAKETDKLEADSTAIITLVSYSPNVLKYESKSSTPQYAVFSEIYYEDGWKAYIDGKQTPYFRADYLLRAMLIPAGEHQIEFRFEPESIKRGNLIASISSILLALGIIGLAFVYYKNRKSKIVNPK